MPYLYPAGYVSVHTRRKNRYLILIDICLHWSFSFLAWKYISMVYRDDRNFLILFLFVRMRVWGIIICIWVVNEVI